MPGVHSATGRPFDTALLEALVVERDIHSSGQRLAPNGQHTRGSRVATLDPLEVVAGRCVRRGFLWGVVSLEKPLDPLTPAKRGCELAEEKVAADHVVERLEPRGERLKVAIWRTSADAVDCEYRRTPSTTDGRAQRVPE